ncbi:MAG TPA: aminotransferase class V-fold PLP-dependent enzyme [Bryobacteraceae bacterium]|jgi:L-seryl-tRNA(Ser) seleniumtransferase|nr:aminotransferase class V-fold PLP-dependent enzyme [Bryobacteraceae bacterium]
MTKSGTRRSFFTWTKHALATAGLLSAAPGASEAANQHSAAVGGEDYYEKLGVTKIINAAGTYTMFTASIMPPSVQAAVAHAAQHPVRLGELQQKAGEYIAMRLKCEAALVSAGAASALTLGTAACMTVGNRKTAELLPLDVAGLKNEVIVQKTHRYGYDHALKNCGIRFVEVETLEQFEQAFTDRTVMCHFFNAAEEGQISREDWVKVAHRHSVPCFNDAAADVPPISNLWNYTQMGFDLVTFSGGKGIRGPQNAGLLLGRKDLIQAAAWNNNPFDETVGRGMKVSKEQIIGMVAAVDWFLSQTDEGMQAEFRRRAGRIASELKSIPTLSHEICVPPVANQVPHLLIRYDQAKVRKSPLEVAEILRAGTPSIELNPSTGRKSGTAGLPSDENSIVVGVWMLQSGEDLIVGRRLRDVLAEAVV